MIPSAESVMMWLWQTSWQVALLILLILAAQIALRRWLSPRWRYGLWALVALRLVMPGMPESPTSLYNLIPGETPTTVAPSNNRHVATASTDRQSTDHKPAVNTHATPIVTTTPVAVPQEAPPVAAPQFAPAAMNSATSSWTLFDVLLVVWLCGAAVLLLRSFISNVALWRRMRRDGRSAPDELQRLLSDCAQEVGVKRAPQLLLLDDVGGPALTGLRQPTLLLPSGIAEQLTTQELCDVMRHELAHIKQHDVVLSWVIITLRAFHWFNPCVWLAAHCAQTDREASCDALALQRCKERDASAYGHTLLKIIELMQAPKSVHPSLTFGGNATAMKRRIHMLAKQPRSMTALAVGSLTALTIIGVGMTGSLSVNSISAAESPSPVVVVPTSVRDLSSDADVDEDQKKLHKKLMLLRAEQERVTAKLQEAKERMKAVEEEHQLLPQLLAQSASNNSEKELREITARLVELPKKQIAAAGELAKLERLAAKLQEEYQRLEAATLADHQQTTERIAWSSVPPKTQQVMEKLSQRMTADFQDTTFPEVINFLRNVSETNMVVMTMPINEALGVDLESIPVTLRANNMRLSTVLRLICEMVNKTGNGNTIGYRIDDGIVVVTSMAPPKALNSPDVESENKALREKLSQKVTVSFQNNDLAEVLKFLGSTTGVNIVVINPSVFVNGVGVTLTLDNTAVDTLLRLCLEQVSTSQEKLSYRIDEGVVIIDASMADLADTTDTTSTATVLAVHNTPSGQQDLVILNIGKGANIKEGLEYNIVRNAQFIVRVRVERIHDHMVACRVISETWNSDGIIIKEGDLAQRPSNITVPEPARAVNVSREAVPTAQPGRVVRPTNVTVPEPAPVVSPFSVVQPPPTVADPFSVTQPESSSDSDSSSSPFSDQ